MRGWFPWWASMSISSAATFVPASALARTASGDPTRLASSRLWSGSHWVFRTCTPGTRRAARMASMTSRRRPSLKFGTISTSGLKRGSPPSGHGRSDERPYTTNGKPGPLGPGFPLCVGTVLRPAAPNAHRRPALQPTAELGIWCARWQAEGPATARVRARPTGRAVAARGARLQPRTGRRLVTEARVLSRPQAGAEVARRAAVDLAEAVIASDRAADTRAAIARDTPVRACVGSRPEARKDRGRPRDRRSGSDLLQQRSA